MEVFNKKIEQRQFDSERRQLLVEVLKKQYDKISMKDQYLSLIDHLKSDKTFTVITAHQPVLFGGPLYVPYKIASAIQLAKRIHASNAQNDIIPVFVIGGEDHDFEEVNHCHIYGKMVNWHSESGSSVGRMSLEGLEASISEVESILGLPKSDIDVVHLLKSCFLNDELNYAEAYQKFIVSLFGEYGLLVANMDDKSFKTAFMPYIKEEILHSPSKTLVESQQSIKAKAGLGTQTFVRDINVFFVSKTHRSVILKEEDNFIIREEDEIWTRDEMIKRIESEPQNFSPNVVMRPIYQEFIFPNIAYIGGGGELSYWAERRSQFEHFDLDFPVLVRRASAMHLEPFIQKRMSDLNLAIEELSKGRHKIMEEKVREETSIDNDINALSSKVLQEFSKLVEVLNTQSESLGKYAMSEERKLEKTLESFQSKSIRELKKENDVLIGKIDKIFDQLFPGNGLQERHDNFLSYLNRNGQEYLNFLVENLDPLSSDIYLLTES